MAEGAGDLLGVSFIRQESDLRGLHPRDWSTIRRPHLLKPSPLRTMNPTCEFWGDTNTCALELMHLDSADSHHWRVRESEGSCLCTSLSLAWFSLCLSLSLFLPFIAISIFHTLSVTDSVIFALHFSVCDLCVFSSPASSLRHQLIVPCFRYHRMTNDAWVADY